MMLGCVHTMVSFLFCFEMTLMAGVAGATTLCCQLRAHLHRVSATTLQEPCDDTSDTFIHNVLIESNGVTQKWVQ